MPSTTPDSARIAADALLGELDQLFTDGPPAPRLRPSTASRDWAASGAMALTRSGDGSPRLAPGAPASWTRAAVAVLGAVSGAGSSGLPPAAETLLGERAALRGRAVDLGGSGGGTFRAVRTRDGWFGLSLSRDSDLDLVPALVEGSAGPSPWDSVARWGATCTAADAEHRARLLGLAGCVVPTAPPPAARPGVLLSRGGRRRPASRPVVVDFSSLWAGPLCSHLLGLVGARVIKVESTRRPDGARAGSSSFYDLLHGGHEAVAVDFTTTTGRRTLIELVRRADVVVEGSRPRALEQLGIDWQEQVAAGTIWVSITARGRSVPDVIGFGDDVAAGAGLVVDDGAGPYPVGDAIGDPLTGVTAAAAVGVGLRGRFGWLIDVSMHDIAAHAASLPGDSAQVIPRSDDWAVQSCGEVFDIRPPTARIVHRTAPSLGADNAAVLGQFT